ncbi:uncharacterized protein LOC118437359 [Folsomia candida]|uniref:Phospholipid-metabolizing enzyme A-C1 n=1 Tax=Folsomia candida TaxID=158441 RepID=A0A226DT84_FOLCA|nr:uncharacterized protein LOC118437359 [Folsomia candida]OXA47416.1 Phospholipid-metabolizing enzyme A-C1 [Folsomia candida]
MDTEIRNIIIFLRNDYIPVVQRIFDKNTALLQSARLHGKNCLISSTVGTVAAAMGGTVAAVATAVATLGVAVVALPVMAVGTGVAIAGAATNLGTTLVDRLLEKDDKDEIQKLFEVLNKETLKFLKVVGILQEELGDYGKECFPNLYEFMDSVIEYCLPTDEDVTVDQLKEGDYIMRPLSDPVMQFLGTHHGICILDGSKLKVLDFWVDGVKLKEMKEFLKGEGLRELRRRNYHGLELPVSETVKRARKQLAHGSERKYSLANYNSEHFAMLLKLGWTRSQQVHRVAAASIGTRAAARTVFAASETFSAVRFISNFRILRGLGTVGKVVSKVGIATAATAPVFIGLDIAFLVYEFKRKKPNIEKLEAFDRSLERTLELLLNSLLELEEFERERLLIPE